MQTRSKTKRLKQDGVLKSPRKLPSGGFFATSLCHAVCVLRGHRGAFHAIERECTLAAGKQSNADDRKAQARKLVKTLRETNVQMKEVVRVTDNCVRNICDYSTAKMANFAELCWPI